MRRFALWLTGAWVMFAATGCASRAFSEALGGALGASGVTVEIQPVSYTPSDRPLGEYRRFVLETFEDGFGGKTPREVFSVLRRAFAERIRETRLPDEPGGKTLLVRGRIIHYERGEGLSGAAFPFSEIIARVELVDQATGRVLAVANCIGRSKATSSSSLDSRTEGVAKAIVDAWISKRFPKEVGRVPKE